MKASYCSWRIWPLASSAGEKASLVQRVKVMADEIGSGMRVMAVGVSLSGLGVGAALSVRGAGVGVAQGRHPAMRANSAMAANDIAMTSGDGRTKKDLCFEVIIFFQLYHKLPLF